MSDSIGWAKGIPIRLMDILVPTESTDLGTGDPVEMPILQRLDGWWEWFTRVYGEAPSRWGNPRRRLYVDSEIMARIDLASFRREQMYIICEERHNGTIAMITYKGIEIVQRDDVTGIVPAELVDG